jgi:hypothetical protein
MLAGQCEQDAACLINIRTVTNGYRDGADDTRIVSGEVDTRLTGHEAIGHYHPAIVVGSQQRVTKSEVLNDPGFHSGGGQHLYSVTKFERPIEQERESCHEVAECVLRGKANHDGEDADTCQRRRT